MDRSLGLLNEVERIAAFAGGYPYLFSNLLGLIPLALLYTAFRRQRPNILKAGLLWVFLAPLAVLHEAYWAPLRLWNWTWGVEDLLYLFNVNAMGWAVAAGVTSRRYRIHLPGPIHLRRVAELIGVGLLPGLLLFLSHIQGMTVQMIVNALIGIWILARSRAYLPIAVAGVLLLPVIFLAELKLWFALWPEFAGAWSPNPPWGQSIAGLPLGEIAFYLTFAMASPTSVAFCFGATLSPRPRPSLMQPQRRSRAHS